jgi:hypothetical protein
MDIERRTPHNTAIVLIDYVTGFANLFGSQSVQENARSSTWTARIPTRSRRHRMRWPNADYRRGGRGVSPRFRGGSGRGGSGRGGSGPGRLRTGVAQAQADRELARTLVPVG